MEFDPEIPAGWPRITTIDAHAAGEPLRTVVDGGPTTDGETMLDRRRDLREYHDDVRTALVWEPRGHRDMYGAVLTDPPTPDGDVGVLFLTSEGYSTMCGHGIVALGTVLVETGVVPASTPSVTIAFDTPAGRVTATAHVDDGRVTEVAFENVPSFVVGLDRTVEVPGLGTVTYDLAYGGAFYAYCDAEPLDLSLTPGNADDIERAGMAIKRAVADADTVAHPHEDDLGFLYGTIFREPTDAADSRNVCVFADGQIDRSPTGTGVSGRLAIRHARGELGVDEPFTVRSIVDTEFTGTVTRTTTCGPHDAVVPSVAGSAHITGRNELVLDPADPLGDGFVIG